ncbi:MAG: c-type cytochrome [Acidimicrobiales bacterium]|nr:c-type cytochrome [Acidimicrobiales bacterium]
MLVALVVLGACSDGDTPASRGRAVAQDVGCLGCHSTGTDERLGPGLGGIWGEERTFADGSTRVVDEEYLRRSILEPGSQVVAGFDPIMPQLALSDAELDEVVAYLRDVAGG